MDLISPNLAFESAFAEFYMDFVRHDPENADYYRPGHVNFARYIQSLENEAEGLDLHPDYVPCSHFWLVNAEHAILGAIRVRHSLKNEFLAFEGGHIGYDIAPSYRGQGYGKTMLKQVLPRAKALGLARALVIANQDNLASRKVIEANGGQLESLIMGKVYQQPLARYWIDCV